jgi:hypothetical protein
MFLSDSSLRRAAECMDWVPRVYLKGFNLKMKLLAEGTQKSDIVTY